MKVVGWRKEAFHMSQFSCHILETPLTWISEDRGVVFATCAVKHAWRWRVQIGFCDLRGNLVVSSHDFRSSGRATSCIVAQGVAYFLVRDVIRILYSLLTSSPPAIASYSTSHIPAANAFFYRSLPSSPLATVSERSIRNSSLPAVPVVWPLLTGGKAASTRDVGLFTLIWSIGSVCSPKILVNRSCQEWWVRCSQKLLRLSLCKKSSCLSGGWNVGCWWAAVLDQCTVWWSDKRTRWKPSPLLVPRLTQPHLTGSFFFFFIASPPCINIVLL